MQERDFDLYRRRFYWFQFNFYLRRQHESPSNRLFRFLYDLYLDDHEAHYRWEYQERGKLPNKIIKRPPRGMRQAEAMLEHQKLLDAMPVQPSSKVFMPKVADKISIRCRYMLFDWLRSRNNTVWDNFDSLYRAMIVFDLHTNGKSFLEIAQSWGADDRSLLEMEDHRLLSGYEKVLKKSLGGLAGCDTEDTLSPRFFRYTGHDRHDVKQEARLSAIKIKQYHAHALKLIDLATTGQFKAIAHFSPPKH